MEGINTNTLNEIFKKRDGKSKLSLERIKKLLDYLDNPQDKLKYIHIAGTNGKGSITTTIANVLVQAGYKVGKYISPFIDNFYERIQINNSYITEIEVEEIFKRLLPYIEKMEDAPTPFEIVAALAFEHFYLSKCDIVCLEVGLGGRFDATNCIGNPLISVINIIDYDHMEYLGDTLEEIAFEKCGIIKENGITVTYPLQDERAYKMIKAVAEIRKNEFIQVDLNRLKNIKKINFNYGFEYKNKRYELGLNGYHQIYNALVVIEVINQLNSLSFKILQEDLFFGIKDTSFIGRLELVSSNPCVILDGAHNSSGAKALKHFILENQKEKKIVLIVAMKQGKNIEEFFKQIASLCKYIVITEIKDDVIKSVDTNELYYIAKKYNENVQIVLDNNEAYNIAIKHLNKEGICLITGSLYLLSNFRFIKQNNYDK